jgi:hypothetical protein
MVVVLVVLVVASAVGAALAGQAAWAAACGSALVLAMWSVEVAVARLGRSGTFGHAVALGLAGMALRVGLAIAVLVVIGIAARPAFPEAALAFVVTYTVYIFARLWWHPAISVEGGRPVAGEVSRKEGSGVRNS